MHNECLPKLLGLVGLLIAVMILPGYAQMADPVAASIPFDFVVAGITLPSGQYTHPQSVTERYVFKVPMVRTTRWL